MAETNKANAGAIMLSVMNPQVLLITALIGSTPVVTTVVDKAGIHSRILL